jgi:hypothetical protein
MNFLTHYALDRKTVSPYFTLGVAIPDLLPLAGRDVRVPYRKLLEHSFDDHEVEEYNLLKGLLHHYYTDRVFHESFFFQYRAQTYSSLSERTLSGTARATVFLFNPFICRILSRQGYSA